MVHQTARGLELLQQRKCRACDLRCGKVDLQSELGRGTVVTCRFPVDPTGPEGLRVSGPPSDIGAPPLSETTSEQLDDGAVAASAMIADKERARSA